LRWIARVFVKSVFDRIAYRFWNAALLDPSAQSASRVCDSLCVRRIEGCKLVDRFFDGRIVDQCLVCSRRHTESRRDRQSSTHKLGQVRTLATDERTLATDERTLCCPGIVERDDVRPFRLNISGLTH